MSEEQKPEETRPMMADPAEEIKLQTIVTRDPNYARFYCDGIHSISFFHGNVKFVLATMEPQVENQPTTRRLVGELILPLRDFLSAVQDEVTFLEKLKASGILPSEKEEERPEPEQLPNSHP